MLTVYSKPRTKSLRLFITRRHEEPQNKAAARDATIVSIVRSGRTFCNFAGRQQLAQGAPVSRMPFCGE